jgi:hypothetical protein
MDERQPDGRFSEKDLKERYRLTTWESVIWAILAFFTLFF